MSDKITYSYAVEVGGKSEVSTKSTMDVDGYSKSEISVPNDGNNKELKDAFPLSGGNASNIKFILIREARDEYDGGLKYAYSKDSGNLVFRSLNHPLILPAGGSIDSAGIEKEDLTLKNEGDAERTVQVIVGRSTS